MPTPELCVPVLWILCERPEAWSVSAAMFQAVLSGVAIVFAVRIATSQERRSLSRKADVLVHLIDHAEATATAILNEQEEGFFEVRALAFPAGEKFTQLAQALDSVQLQDLPDYRLLAPIQTTARTCHFLAKEMTKICAIETIPEAGADYLQRTRGARDALEGFYNEAAQVANELVVRSPRQWFNWKRLEMSRGKGH